MPSAVIAAARLRGRRAGLQDGSGHCRVATLDERDESPLEGSSIEEHVPPTRRAAHPDVGPQAIHAPLVAAARMPPSQPNDVAEKQLQYGAVAHRRARVSEAWGAVARD